jgi:membrane protein DedA with SNARE-associated domain
MTPELLLHKFGYLAVFVGTFLEGETILVMAGFFAERGYMDIFIVALVAALGAYAGHVFWFWLGRRYGVRLLDRFPRMKTHFGRASACSSGTARPRSSSHSGCTGCGSRPR